MFPGQIPTEEAEPFDEEECVLYPALEEHDVLDNQNFRQNASLEKCKTVYQSFGIFFETFQNLTIKEK